MALAPWECLLLGPGTCCSMSKQILQQCWCLFASLTCDSAFLFPAWSLGIHLCLGLLKLCCWPTCRSSGPPFTLICRCYFLFTSCECHGSHAQGSAVSVLALSRMAQTHLNTLGPCSLPAMTVTPCTVTPQKPPPGRHSILTRVLAVDTGAVARNEFTSVLLLTLRLRAFPELTLEGFK